jgi:undecaprenyl-diphosphatase
MREKMLLNFFQVIALAILQGVTELFPVSSLGHAVVLPALLIWPFDAKGPGMLPFLVILHLGTATALLLFFWRDWVDLLLAAVGLGNPAERPALRRLIVMLVVGTVPAALAGLLLNKLFRDLFGIPAFAAMMLILNGVLLWVGDRKQRGRAGGTLGDGKPLGALTLSDALIIGLAQCTALLPGISRSGATIVTGMGRRLTPDAAAHFSFLLAAPIIGGAALLEVPKLLLAIHQGHADADYLTKSIIGGVVAGIAAFFSVWFLTRYFKTTELKMMRPFAIYCFILGIGATAWLVLR